MSPAARFAAPSFVFAGADASKRDRRRPAEAARYRRAKST
jgi:hypothetical protein